MPVAIGMSWTKALNDRHQVVGDTGTFVTSLWQNGTVTDIGRQVGDMWNRAEDINAEGWVAGSADAAPFAWLWRNGVVTDLGTLGGSYAFSAGINDIGQIVGWADVPDGSRQDAFIWRDGHITDIGTFTPIDINNNGDVAGTRIVDQHSRACLWHHGVLQDLPVPGENTYAQAINNRGEILVSSGSNDGTQVRTFLWSDGRVQPVVVAGAQTYPVSLNDRTQVLVYAITADGRRRSYLWQHGRFTDLASVGLSSTAYTYLVDIDNHGDVLTDSTLYLLNPRM